MTNEFIMGVETKKLKTEISTEYGFISNKKIYAFIIENLKIKQRDLAERDMSFKQIIPYLCITFQAKYLLYFRTTKQSETRLHNKYSLGIGGHINPIDIHSKKDTLLNGLERELKEEIHIRLTHIPKFIGILNDDISEVGKVHLGVAFLGHAVSQSFNVKEKEKIKCRWVSREFIINNFDKLENWSQILFTFLESNKLT